jgi:excisionase family DNA binding protein
MTKSETLTKPQGHGEDAVPARDHNNPPEAIEPEQADLERLTYQVEEVAKILGIGRNQAYEAVRSGQIPAIRIGKRLLIPKAAIRRMLSAEGRA